MICSSPKHVLVMLLAGFLAVGLSLTTVQASVMSARMMMMTGSGMTVPGTSAIVDTAMDGACKACLKGSGDSGNVIHCPPMCVAPVLAVLPHGLAMRMAMRAQRLSARPAPLLHGRRSVPDPFPPRPNDLL